MCSVMYKSFITSDHYSHGPRWLQQVDEAKPFLCDGCKSPGFGVQYRCNHEGCYADLHIFCSGHASTINFFMHPHKLRFMTRPREGWTVICDVCQEPITGCFYACPSCSSFDTHPVCAQLPDTVHDSAHPAHRLTYLFPRDPAPCGGCGDPCDGWRYRCTEDCHPADFHLECLQGPAIDVRELPPVNHQPEWFASRGYIESTSRGFNEIATRGWRRPVGNAPPGRRRKRDMILALGSTLMACTDTVFTMFNIYSLISDFF